MPTLARQLAPTSAQPTTAELLQRKCAKCQHEEDEKMRLGIQTKLKVSQPGDALEQEADRVARRIVSQPAHALADRDPQIHRSASSPHTWGHEAHSVIANAGAAQPLPATIRADFESRFSTDLSSVRIHTGARAASSADSFDADAYALGNHIVFGQNTYQPSTTCGKQLLAHELTHVLQHSAGGSADLSRKEQSLGGPQSFAPATPGSVSVDPAVVEHSRALERELFGHADLYRKADDSRWFFTLAHATITRLLLQNLQHFQRPDALLALNTHFATAFLNGVHGHPHLQWQETFQSCEEGLTDEGCGASMAHTHISVDLAAALAEVGCIPPADYGNMLAIVNEGTHKAVEQMRGVLSPVWKWGMEAIGPLVDLDVETWRNAVYQNVCGQPVPEVSTSFPTLDRSARSSKAMSAIGQSTTSHEARSPTLPVAIHRQSRKGARKKLTLCDRDFQIGSVMPARHCFLWLHDDSTPAKLGLIEPKDTFTFDNTSSGTADATPRKRGTVCTASFDVPESVDIDAVRTLYQASCVAEDFNLAYNNCCSCALRVMSALGITATPSDFPAANQGTGLPDGFGEGWKKSAVQLFDEKRPTLGVQGGTAISPTGDAAWHTTLYLGYERHKPVVGLFYPHLQLGIGLVGTRLESGANDQQDGKTFLINVLSGLTIDPGERGGFVAGVSAGAGVNVDGHAGLNLEAGVALGYRWEVLDVRANASVSYDPTRSTDAPQFYSVGATATLRLAHLFSR